MHSSSFSTLVNYRISNLGPSAEPQRKTVAERLYLSVPVFHRVVELVPVLANLAGSEAITPLHNCQCQHADTGQIRVHPT